MPRLEGHQSGRKPPEFVLSLQEARIVADALADAISLRYNHLSAPCADCRPNQPCPRHRADMATAREYRTLRAELGALLPRPDDRWAT
jgi:hypothetical protein